MDNGWEEHNEIVKKLMIHLDIIDEGKIKKGFSRIKFENSPFNFIVTSEPFEFCEDDEERCICGNKPTEVLRFGHHGVDFCCNNKFCIDNRSEYHAKIADIEETVKYIKLLERAIKWAQK
jgi:hypothetical protein